MARKAKYRREHIAMRNHWKPIVEAGQARCSEPICLMPNRLIHPASQWHLSHDPTGSNWIGPSHARCNLAENARRNNPKRGARRWTL